MKDEKKRKEEADFSLLDGVKVVLSALVIAFLLTTFVVSSTIVEGSSMENTLQNRDRLFIIKLGVNEGSLKQGDIIVFHAPDSDKDYIKRVIAFPHDFVQIEDGLVYVNGNRLEEPYIKSDYTQANGETEWYVPEGEIFVLGDNRDPGASKDSRFFGPIRSSSIVGRAAFRFFPFSRLGSI